MAMCTGQEAMHTFTDIWLCVQNSRKCTPLLKCAQDSRQCTPLPTCTQDSRQRTPLPTCTQDSKQCTPLPTHYAIRHLHARQPHRQRHNQTPAYCWCAENKGKLSVRAVWRTSKHTAGRCTPDCQNTQPCSVHCAPNSSSCCLQSFLHNFLVSFYRIVYSHIFCTFL